MQGSGHGSVHYIAIYTREQRAAANIFAVHVRPYDVPDCILLHNALIRAHYITPLRFHVFFNFKSFASRSVSSLSCSWNKLSNAQASNVVINSEIRPEPVDLLDSRITNCYEISQYSVNLA